MTRQEVINSRDLYLELGQLLDDLEKENKHLHMDNVIKNSSAKKAYIRHRSKDVTKALRDLRRRPCERKKVA